MLKLISLNVERSKHLSRIIPFIQSEEPDILALQEVLERDLSEFQRQSGLDYAVWLRQEFIDHPTNTGHQSDYSDIALLSRYPLSSQGSKYYYMPKAGISLQAKPMIGARATNAQGIVWASIEKDGETFTVVNTHFTWTPDGYPNEYQETDFIAFKDILSKIGPHILMGDLNASRGRGMWEKFSTLYDQDGIPASTETTIDPDFHKSKSLRLVVDALFADRSYQIQSVEIVAGLSDHKAVVATISRANE